MIIQVGKTVIQKWITVVHPLFTHHLMMSPLNQPPHQKPFHAHSQAVHMNQYITALQLKPCRQIPKTHYWMKGQGKKTRQPTTDKTGQGVFDLGPTTQSSRVFEMFNIIDNVIITNEAGILAKVFSFSQQLNHE